MLRSTQNTLALNRAAYFADLPTFRHDSDAKILNALAQAQVSDLTHEQREAWRQQVEILKFATGNLSDGHLAFECLIPRMGKRADNVLIVGNVVIVLEFKVGAKQYDRWACTQAIDYALDLKYFHQGSRDATVCPILCATEAPSIENSLTLSADKVSSVLLSNKRSLAKVICEATRLGHGPAMDVSQWISSGYMPTPTIVEASQALYRGHSVAEITRSEAGATNLTATTEALSRIIDEARKQKQKAICFVTGVPGAGKTLAGLTLASERRRTDLDEDEHAVFLSGNGPLVKVLHEALVRDDVARSRLAGTRTTKEEASRKVRAFVQNIHHFRDECVENQAPPTEHVVVFDEAQRAWDREQTTKFMRKRGKQWRHEMSEPEFLIAAMDRHEGWAVIVCLIGDGQEINTGEAGIEEWFHAVHNRFPHWQVYVPLLSVAGSSSTGGESPRTKISSKVLPSLHLNVCLRSFRSEKVASFVHALLARDKQYAQSSLKEIQAVYPIRITRSLDDAKTWIRQQARGTERFGLLASSGALRLKPHGIFASGVKGKECNWFLDSPEDVRSSYYLEDAASEFEVQGLELDWAIVVWDGDFVFQDADWLCQKFRGTRWARIRKKEAQFYKQNAYRVLLTRARQGLVIVVPQGSHTDATRDPELYDPTWEYLRCLGIRPL